MHQNDRERQRIASAISSMLSDVVRIVAKKRTSRRNALTAARVIARRLAFYEPKKEKEIGGSRDNNASK